MSAEIKAIYPSNNHLKVMGGEIRRLIENLCQDRPYTYAEIIGVLEMVKHDFLHEQREP